VYIVALGNLKAWITHDQYMCIYVRVVHMYRLLFSCLYIWGWNSAPFPMDLRLFFFQNVP